MSDAIQHLHQSLKGLEVPEGWLHQHATIRETAFVAVVRGEPLEIEGSDAFVSISYGDALWEDLRLQTVNDADRILSACDAILDGRYSKVRTGNWWWHPMKYQLDLSTRGFSERLTDTVVGMFGSDYRKKKPVRNNA